MSNYYVRHNFNEELLVVAWNVIEKKTDQVVESFMFEEDARDYKRFLNGGGAFNGFTPQFILTRVVPTDNTVNQQFETIFSVEE